MINRRRIALAAVSISCFLPTVVHAGAGGTPAAPGAGKSTDYCCATWERVDPRRHGDDSRGDQKALSFLNGSGNCSALDELDTTSRNMCPGTVVKCRGEFFTPSEGKVQRCFTP